jgi:glycosyltransferase involved in cell wall biosynthesis
MMRIALVVPGGVDQSAEYRVIPALISLIRRLSLHHEVHVFALNQEPTAREWDLAGARIHNIGPRRARLRTVSALYRLHGSKPLDIVQAIWAGACGQIAVAAGTLLRVPSLIHVAGGEPVALVDINFGGQLHWPARWADAVALRTASVVTTASAGMIRALADLQVEAQRLPLGADRQLWPPQPPRRRTQGRPARLIQVASLNRVKDQTTLLKALAQLASSGASFEMDLVGEDTLQGAMQSLSAQLGLSRRVRFRGFMTQRELRPLVEAADLMIVSSRHEAGPLSMLEAALLGVPTVGTAVGHVAEYAAAAAVAVPVGDPQCLGNAIADVLADEELRLSLAEHAQQWATREDADHSAQRFQALYGQLRASRS